MLGVDTLVLRNRSLTVDECLRYKPQYIVIGPGPGSPAEAGISKSLIAASAGKIPLLGVCLGHQALVEAYGGEVVRAGSPMHGKTSYLKHDSQGIFRGLSQDLRVTRYHSLIAKRDSFPSCLKITASTDEGEIMGLRHREYAQEGVQFHPESILTEHGMDMLRNFLDNAKS